MTRLPYPDRLLTALITRMDAAQACYSDFASTHEALGVALEEWTELIAEIHANNATGIRDEALDLSAVCLRLADHCERADPAFMKRSGCEAA